MDHVVTIDYKDIERISRYISERGMIEPRRKTGTCYWHQRRLATAIKRARHLALLPYTQAHMWLTGSLVLRRGTSRGAPMVQPLRAPVHAAPQAAPVAEETEATAAAPAPEAVVEAAVAEAPATQE
mgnify:FL=1